MKVYCQAEVSEWSGISAWYSQCQKTGTYEVEGTLNGKPYTAHICGTHRNKLQRGDYIDIYTEESKSTWRGKESFSFRAEATEKGKLEKELRTTKWQHEMLRDRVKDVRQYAGRVMVAAVPSLLEVIDYDLLSPAQQEAFNKIVDAYGEIERAESAYKDDYARREGMQKRLDELKNSGE